MGLPRCPSTGSPRLRSRQAGLFLPEADTRMTDASHRRSRGVDDNIAVAIFSQIFGLIEKMSMPISLSVNRFSSL